MSNLQVHAYAQLHAKAPLEPFQYELPDIRPDQVDIKVEYCGLCHSDLSMLQSDWGVPPFPLILGHEVVGTIVGAGACVQGLQMGDRVGLGWFSSSCMHCDQCLLGNHNMCRTVEKTIIGRHGGFADVVRCHWVWASPLPKDLDASKAGPLFCGGLTVFNPLIQAQVKPTHHVGVIGIGGLGHLALQFLNKWGCEVTAFTSSPNKEAEAKKLGAHHVVHSRDDSAMQKISRSLDFILNTTNVNLNWAAYVEVLAPKGVLHTVGIVPDPIPVPVFPIVDLQRSVSGSPMGSPATTRMMLEFCTRHHILPMTEEFNLSDINEAFAHLKAGKARYRIVLKV